MHNEALGINVLKQMVEEPLKYNAIKMLFLDVLWIINILTSVKPLTCGTELIRFNIIHIMVADALAPCVARTSAPILLTTWDRYVLVLLEENLQLHGSRQCGGMTLNVKKKVSLSFNILARIGLPRYLTKYPQECRLNSWFVAMHLMWHCSNDIWALCFILFRLTRKKRPRHYHWTLASPQSGPITRQMHLSFRHYYETIHTHTHIYIYIYIYI